MFVVYKEIFTESGFERWYYGCYDHNTANNVAQSLGNGVDVFGCVCEASEAHGWNIRNLPAHLA